MAEMERKPSLKERAFERLGISALRQKSNESHVIPSTLLPSGDPSTIHNGQFTGTKPISISVIQDLRPISNTSEMPQGPAEKRKRRPKPEGTIEYQVQRCDTLESIAAQFDTTPSELAKLNKLPTRMIFSGQDIFVPDPNHDSGSELSVSPPLLSPPSTSPPIDNKPRMDIPIVKMADAPPKRIPGHVERQISVSSEPELPPRKLSEDEARELDQECYERFIKVNVKHITDGQGVVSGVLLVTPNAIMFDPNVSDALVIENGPVMYGMMAPMDTVISAAMYHDIAAMKLKGQQPEERACSPRPEVYHSKTCALFEEPTNELKCYRGDNSLNKNTKSNGAVSEKDSCSCGADDQSKSSIIETDIPIGLNVDQSKSCVSNSNNYENKTDNSDVNLSGNELVYEEAKAIVNEVVRKAVETELNLRTNSGDGVSLPQNESPDTKAVSVSPNSLVNELNVQPLVFLSDTVSKEDKDSALVQLQSSLKELDLESTEITINSSGTGTLIDTSGEANLYTSCATELSSDLTDDSLLESKKEQSDLGKDECNPMTSSPGGVTGEMDSQHLTQHMQIGNITYYQYPNLREGVVLGPDGTQISIQQQRPASKSEPIAMPATNKEDVTGGKSSSFGSFTNSPHISAFVNYATGLFRSTADDHELVKDITEVKLKDDKSSSSVDGNSGSHMDSPQRNTSFESSDKHVSVENVIKLRDMPELFQSIDKLIPRPAARVEDPPLYLCLRVGKPIHQRAHSTGPIESYSRKKKKPEYWFSIPRDKVDQLYAFFVQWSPEKYGDEDEIDPASRGFVVVDDEDPEANEDEALDIFEEYFGPSSSQRIHRDWEIVNKEEFRRRSIDVYEPLPLPELIGTSAILTEDHIIKISRILPGRAVGYPWTLIYSTETNGFSLKTLYRNMIGLEGPILLVVEDTGHNIFGALVACPLTVSEHFYGTGESFLYTFSPEFCVYNWSGENNFFIKGNKDSLAIGAGRGVFGLWFDEDLYHGRSNHCETYNNDPLTASEDFVLKGLEAWAFCI